MMIHLLRWAGALALALMPALAIAQVAPNTPARAPAGFLPSQASFCSADGGTTWVPCAGGGGGGSSGPTRASSTVAAGTIATANTYQSALAVNASRLGCSIQNTSTTTLRVFVGAPGSATDAAAFQIAAGGTFGCGSPGGVILTDQISVAAATASSSYVVVSQ